MKKILIFCLLLPLAGLSQAPVMISIQGPSVACVSPGQPITFAANASNSPQTFFWSVSPAAGVIISGSSPVCNILFPNLNMSYTVTCAAGNGSGVSAPLSKVVQVFEIPNVTFTGLTNVCQGSATFLMASPTMQSSSTTLNFTWTPTTGVLAPNSPATPLNPPVTTNYTVLVSNGPCSNSDTVTVVVNPSPTITASSSYSIICKGESAVLTLNGAQDPYYVNAVPMLSGSSISPTSTTTYFVAGMNSFGCIGFTAFTQTVSACVAIKTQASESNMLLYPNPSLGAFYIKSQNNEKAYICNQIGAVVRNIELHKNKETSVYDLDPGVYFLVTPTTRIKVIVYR